MNHRIFLLIIFFVVFFPGIGAGTNNGDFVQYFGTGFINWGSGVIQAKGVSGACIPPCEGSAANTEDEARRKAADNIFKTLECVKIDNRLVAGDLLLEDGDFANRVQDMITVADAVGRQTIDGGRTEITLQMSIHGGFAQFVLPEDIKPLKTVRPITAPVETEKNNGDAQHENQADVYTGLVIDARGLGVIPAMSPTVFDEDGEEVFGPAFISREYAVQHGVCCYLTDVDSALANERVDAKPLLVKAVRLHGAGTTDLVISNADAARLRSASDHLGFLRQCRVIIVAE